MSIQLPLPGQPLYLSRDPQDELDAIARDKLDAKFEIRQVLERYAAKHGVGVRNVNEAVRGYAGDMLDDFFYEFVGELQHEIEDQTPV